MLVNVEHAWLLNLVLGVPLGHRHASRSWLEAAARSSSSPRTFVLGARALAGLRELVDAGDPSVAELADALRRQADAAAEAAPESVVDKMVAPFGAHLHDYVSLARYYWPDDDSVDALPYVRRDGQVNPASYGDGFDASRLERFSDRLVLLGIAAYVLRDERFGRAGERLVETWFVDERTAQTPHARFAQVVPGRTAGTGYGLVETRRYVYVGDAVALLHAAGFLDERVHEGYRRWLTAFDAWLATSEQGRHAAEATNNIGFWYDVQRIAYLRHLGRDDEARTVLRDATVPRIRDQVEADGRMVRELERAKPQEYVVFTLLALAELAALAEDGEIDLASYGDEAGRNYQNAFAWFADTLAANDLGDRIVVLERVAADQRTIAALRARLGEAEARAVGASGEGAVLDERRALIEGAMLARAVMRDHGIALRDVSERLEHVERKLHDTTEDLEHVERKLHDTTEDLERALADAETARTRVASLEKKLVATTRTLSEMRSGFSWRVTQPLRTAKGLVQDVRRKGVGRSLERFVRRRGRSGDDDSTEAPASIDPLAVLRAHVVPDEAAREAAYRASAIAAEPHTFALVRVIGNDLYPRHKVGQSRENVAFILEREPALEACTRAWIVNRIVDQDEERAVIELLEHHGEAYRRIPFDPAAYAAIGFDHDALPEPTFMAGPAFAELEPLMQRRLVAALYRHKNRYVMHNNGARNAALDYGRTLATWVLPWDGNCYLRADAWRALREAVIARPHLPYFVTPMQRVEDNAQLLAADLDLAPGEEPQLVFRRDAAERFDEAFPYGRRPKVELLWRLGVPGPWNRWNDDPWDQPRNQPSTEAGAFGVAGWVARLASGAAHLERATTESFKNRGRVRQDAIISTIDRIDRRVHGVPADADPDGLGLVAFEPAAIVAARASYAAGTPAPVLERLLADAAEAARRGPYSVVDKTTLPPSGDRHDYWHPAPYWWPNPATRDGLPYVRRDGERVPGTRMYEPDSDRYDRTRLQRCLDDTTALALAGTIAGRDDHLERAALLVRRWFLDPSTRMHPHLRYAQVRMGHRGNEGTSFGIIEMKDLYYALDAVRILERSGALTEQDMVGMREWLARYLAWLQTSPQGVSERLAPNNHGIYYDLHTAAVIAFLGDETALRDVLLRAEGRLHGHFDRHGDQPHERERPIAAHYYLFNLQGWLHLLQLGARYGFVPSRFDVAPYDHLERGVRRLFDIAGPGWPYAQQEDVDWERLGPLASTAIRVGLGDHVGERWRSLDREAWLAATERFDPHDGVMPYWNLAWYVAPVRRGSGTNGPDGR